MANKTMKPLLSVVGVTALSCGTMLGFTAPAFAAADAIVPVVVHVDGPPCTSNQTRTFIATLAPGETLQGSVTLTSNNGSITITDTKNILGPNGQTFPPNTTFTIANPHNDGNDTVSACSSMGGKADVTFHVSEDENGNGDENENNNRRIKIKIENEPIAKIDDSGTSRIEDSARIDDSGNSHNENKSESESKSKSKSDADAKSKSDADAAIFIKLHEKHHHHSYEDSNSASNDSNSNSDSNDSTGDSNQW